MAEYVGFDVSKEETAFCVKNDAGATVVAGKVATDPAALFAAVREHCPSPARVVMETGTYSGWLAREMEALGQAVDVVDARRVHAVLRLQTNKTDAKDAALPADIARTKFCPAVSVKRAWDANTQALLRARGLMVRQRRDAENTVRGILGSAGIRLSKGSGRFSARVREAVMDTPLQEAVEPLLVSLAQTLHSLKALTRQVEARARASKACRLSMTAPAVGPMTAVALVANLGDAKRFADSRSVGAYVGLVPRRRQSGEMDWTGRISRHGDPGVRSLLYECAACLLTRVKRGHPLKDWARRLRKRSGFKKACVALARRLAVILHRMLVSGEPFRWPDAAEAA